ncbi:MAG TPA: hypothetical protein VMR44_03080 [Thermoanaerobaculia bacterium]|nr:hypothetical protein [Thermoanaerobaculia bacterium]
MEPKNDGGSASRAAARARARIAVAQRSLVLNFVAALLALPWLGIVVWWRGWPAWLLVVPVYFALRWLLDRLTHPDSLRELEGRLGRR